MAVKVYSLHCTYLLHPSSRNRSWMVPIGFSAWGEKLIKRKRNGMNYNPCCCSWTWGCNWCLSSPSSTNHSKFPSSSAILCAGLTGFTWWCDPNFHFWELRALENQTFLRMGSPYLPIHIRNWARGYQEAPMCIIWVAHILEKLSLNMWVLAARWCDTVGKDSECRVCNLLG